MKKKNGRPPIKVAVTREERERLEHVYRTSDCPKDRQKAQAVLLAADGTRTYAGLARIVMRCPGTVFNWVRAFTSGGVDGLLGHAPHTGRPSPMGRPDIREAVARGLAEGAWVNSRHAAGWLASEFGLARAASTMRYWLGKLGGAHKVPRPSHTKKDAAAAADFKARLSGRFAALGIPAGSRVRVWAADEARYGLRDGLRRCWCARGRTVVKPMQMDYEWGYLYGALDVVTGASEFRALPTVSLELTLGFLGQISQSDPGAVHVVLWDNAGFHQAPDSPALPGNVRILPFPPYSPELNPAERAWEFIRDEIGNRVYGAIEAMDDAVCAAARRLIDAPAKVLGLVGGGWMHVQANAS
jgi:transposase